jgi:parallel beta-helix repeat protein
VKRSRRIGLAAAALLAVCAGHALAAERHVSTIGNDGAAGTLAAPFRTLRRALATAGPGDSILLHAGTYPERISTDDGEIRGGSSWANALVIAALPGDTVVLQPPSGSTRVVMLANPRASYIVIRGLALDARNVTYDAVKITGSLPDASKVSHHIRIEDSEVANAPGQGLLVLGHHNEFIRLRVHDHGTTDFNHGFYIVGPDNLIDGCDVYRNAGAGVNVYNGNATDADRNVVRGNRLHHNARVGRRGTGLVVSSGEDNLAYNNVVFANKDGILVNYGATRSRIYNNTVFAQRELGIYVGAKASDTDVRNNLVFRNRPDFANVGRRTTIGTNLIGVEDRIADAASFDARLLETSTAIDSGATLDAVRIDHDGAPRPQGAGYDIGAFEYPRNQSPTLPIVE